MVKCHGKICLDIAVVAIMAVCSNGCTRNFVKPPEVGLLRTNGKVMSDLLIRESCPEFMVTVDGLIHYSIRKTDGDTMECKPNVPQLANRMDAIEYSDKSNQRKSDLIVRTHKYGEDSFYDVIFFCSFKDSGNGFIAANCIATSYIYKSMHFPKQILYTINGHIPSERQMREIVKLDKSNLRSVSLAWEPDSVLTINISTRHKQGERKPYL